MKKYYHLFLLLFVGCYSSLLFAATPIDDTKAQAAATIQEIEKSGHWVNSFSPQDMTSLPVGIRHTISNTQYSIGITKAKVTNEYTELTVFCRIDIPQTDSNGNPIQLFFGAENIKMSPQGNILENVKLVLLGNVDIPFNANKWLLSLYGGFDMKTGTMADLTYVTIGCEGFKNLKITGAVEISRDIVLPIEANGLVDESKTTVPKTYYNGQTKAIPNRVRGEFSFQTASWNDILVNLSLSPFVMKDKLNGKDYDGNFQFMVSNAVFDFSDANNSPNVVFPDAYTQNGLLPPDPNCWRGIFIENFTIDLPKQFKTTTSKAQNKRISIGASHLILDKYGVSGTFFATNVFPLNEGRTGDSQSWAYSLDDIRITIEANTFVKANLTGEILLPITKQSEAKNIGLRYIGFISPQEQRLTVANTTAINFDIWKAKATLLPNSSVELKLVDGNFLPKANLYGTLSIATNKNATDQTNGGDKKTVAFDGITFQNLQLQTVAPYIKVDSMGYQGTVAFANFPVSIGNINITIQDTAARMDFNLGLNLMESSGMSALARLGLKAKITNEDGRQCWKYDGLDLSSISVNANFSGLKIKGNLNLMENDPVYGDGFNADLNVDVVGVVTVGAKACFGKSTFRYWYFDAAAQWPSAPTVFMINGFAGGAYYKMKRKPEISRSEFSPSGLSYIPDETVGLGLKALVNFYMAKEEVIDGSAGLELSFNTNGGVNTMAIFGNVSITSKVPGMDKINEVVDKVAANTAAINAFLTPSSAKPNGSFTDTYLKKAQTQFPKLENKMGINGEAAIEFDFQNNTLHGTFDLAINTPGNFLSGAGPGGKAGWAVMHKDSKDWYLYVGTPDNRCGMRIGIAGINLQATGYFMTGTLLPGSPPPPPIVAEILGVSAEELNYMRNENALANGGGFAFGAALDFDTGDMSFLIFYARFQAGIGFDIMLKDYQEARCSNTGGQVGINGWYANGQAYAYLQGELGVNVKLLFVRLKIPIISAGAAVLLQAKLPNPTWLRGYVGGHMNVLGGLIKGRFRFKVTIGEECVFENASPLGGLKLITDVTPKNGSADIDVFAVPQATFALKVNEPIVIPEDQGDVTYKVVLEKCKLFDGPTEIPATMQWSESKDRVNLVSTDILPPQRSLKVQVEVSFQKLENGVFRPIIVDGQVAKETEERDFTTGTAPNYIPLTNIQYCYPVVDQKYFYEEEYGKGYIQLKRGQDYLFKDAAWETKVKYAEQGKANGLYTDFDYNNITNEVSYMLPDISQSKGYTLSITSYLKAKGAKSSDTPTTKSLVDGQEGNNITITQNQAQSVSKDGQIDRLTYNFNTSESKSFLEKMNAIHTKKYHFGVIYSDVINLSTSISKQEAYDVADLQGTEFSDNKPLMVAEAALSDNYFLADINPYLYGQYPLGGLYEITNREVKEFGIVPTKAILINSYYLLSIKNDVNQDWTKTSFPYVYNLPLIYKQDWVDLKNQIVNDYVNNKIASNNTAINFILKEFLFMRGGFYDVKLKYTLPGNKRVSEFVYQFKNENRFR